MTTTLPPSAGDEPVDDPLEGLTHSADDRTLAQIMLSEAADAPPSSGLRRITGGQPLLPLLVLFGLSMFSWMERATGQLLLPEMQKDFGLSDGAMLAIGMTGVVAALLLTVPVAFYADRFHRVRLMRLGAAVFAAFSLATGAIPLFWWAFLIVQVGAAMGQATVFPTHNALLTDYYDIPHRPKVFAIHGGAQGMGSVLGAVGAGTVAEAFGWRVPFVVIGIPCLALVLVATRLREPLRGHYERHAMGVGEGEAAPEIDEDPPTLEEAQRLVHRIASLRRLFYAIPFLAISLVGFGLLANFMYADEFGLGPGQRGLLEGLSDAAQLIGIALSAVVGTKLLRKDPANVLRLVFVASVVAGFFVVVFALAPNLPVAVAARMGIAISLAAILPSMFAALSMTIPARARSTGFSMALLYILPGLPIILFAGWLSDNYGVRVGLLFMAPMLVLGGYIASTAHKVLDADIKNVWTTTAAQAEICELQRQGQIKQLIVRGVDVKYGDVQILFGVDFEVEKGEIVALLGTNGAGKSTLLKAITGVVEASSGTVLFDGRDITSSPPHEIAGMGIAMVPGGQGVFPSLTVAENLKVACWNRRRRFGRDGSANDDAIERVLTTFPVLRDRLGDPAANLSGGQQQMLALGMAFLSEPTLLVIDELSLGLAPVIVEKLIDIVRAIRDQGTTVILVEQSVNVALTLAETAYFMEKGEIRFHGPTAELLERPDVLRSVFLEGAAAHLDERQEPGTVTEVRDRSVSAPAATAGLDVPALEVRGLSVRFGGILAVDDVSVRLQPGEILGVIGPNGAGKTTLFDLVSGFTTADSGRVLLHGKDISGKGADGRARAGLGRSFQDALLFPALTVEESIKVALERFTYVKDPFNAMLRLPVQQTAEFQIQRQVDELIELLGIESFRSKFVRELSTGSRRVVDLACVLAHRPSVVLLDEPSSGIAQRETEALGPLIHRLRRELQASIILIEHDMPLITSVADRLLALDQGRAVIDGPAADVLNHPQVVASYLGTRDDVIHRSGTRAPS